MRFEKMAWWGAVEPPTVRKNGRAKHFFEPWGNSFKPWMSCGVCRGEEPGVGGDGAWSTNYDMVPHRGLKWECSPEYKSSLIRSGNMYFFDYSSSLVTRIIHVTLPPRIPVLFIHSSKTHLSTDKHTPLESCVCVCVRVCVCVCVCMCVYMWVCV